MFPTDTVSVKQDHVEVSLPSAAPEQKSHPEAEQPSERPPEPKPEPDEFSEFVPGTTCKLVLTVFSFCTFKGSVCIII